MRIESLIEIPLQLILGPKSHYWYFTIRNMPPFGFERPKWVIEEVDGNPKYMLWQRAFIGWNYITASDNRKELEKKITE